MTETTSDTRESLLAAYDEWRARRDRLDRREDSRVYQHRVSAAEWQESDTDAVELAQRMADWLRCLVTC